MPAVRVVHFPCALVPRPMSVVFGLRVRMHTKFKNGILHNEQQPQRVVNDFIGQGEFEAMKSLGGWEAACCDEHPFCAKMKVSA